MRWSTFSFKISTKSSWSRPCSGGHPFSATNGLIHNTHIHTHTHTIRMQLLILIIWQIQSEGLYQSTSDYPFDNAVLMIKSPAVMSKVFAVITVTKDSSFRKNEIETVNKYGCFNIDQRTEKWRKHLGKSSFDGSISQLVQQNSRFAEACRAESIAHFEKGNWFRESSSPQTVK